MLVGVLFLDIFEGVASLDQLGLHLGHKVLHAVELFGLLGHLLLSLLVLLPDHFHSLTLVLQLRKQFLYSFILGAPPSEIGS